MFSSLEKEALDIFDYLAVDDDIHALFGNADDVNWDFPSQIGNQNFELLETHGGGLFDRRILKKDIQGILSKEVTSLENKLNKVREENKALQTANDNIKETAQKEKQLIETEKRELASSISNLESANENLEKSTTDLKAKLNQSNEVLKKTTAERDTALDRVKSLEQEKRELASSISNLESANENLEKSTTDLKGQIESKQRGFKEDNSRKGTQHLTELRALSKKKENLTTGKRFLILKS